MATVNDYTRTTWQTGDVIDATKMNNIETQLDAVTDNARENGIAPVFSTTKTYAVGEHVLYNGEVYRCKTAVASAGAWVASNWTKASLSEDLEGEVSELKSAINGEEIAVSGGSLKTGYYVKNNGAVTSSANFNTYKYDISNADFVIITTYGYNSTASVASNSNYDEFTIVGKTFSPATDKLIYPAYSISTISAWTEKVTVDEYDYLYVSCYKNNTPTVYAFKTGGCYPRSLNNESEIEKINTQMLSVFASNNVLLNSAERWSPYNSDANNLIPNKLYTITYNTNVSHLPYTGFSGFIASYMAYYGNSTIGMQEGTRGNGKEIYKRVLWGGTWTNWFRIAMYDDVSMFGSDIDFLKHEADLWTIFHTVGVIGDSLASGESASNEGGSTTYHDIYPFSWGQCLARESGNTYYNFSKGGLTTKTWMTDAYYGYALASQEDKLCDAYIIGLGQNDAGQQMTVGTSADINMSDPDQNADTFYGNYGKIIQKMQAIAPKAPIFVCSRPTVPASNAYETAIRAMPTIFNNVYLIDLYKYVNAFYDNDSIIKRCLRSGHYNAVAYKLCSKYISQEISNIIVENLDDFKQVEFINTEWSWTDT